MIIDELTAICGPRCTECDAYKATRAGRIELERIANEWTKNLIVIPLVPAVLISTRDSSHFGVSGMIRWVIVGALIGAVGGILSEILPSVEQTSALIPGLAIFAFRIIIGLVVILSSYWLVFRLPTVVSNTCSKTKG